MARTFPLVSFFLVLASAVFGQHGDKRGETQPGRPLPGTPGTVAAAARPLTPAEQAWFEQGRTIYAALCGACHQPEGQGQEGVAPPLVNSRWILGDPRIVARIILNGKTRENLIMPPWKAALDDRAAAAVLTYVRRSWGHEADPVTPAIVAEARAATAKRDELYQDGELEELARSLPPRRK